MVGSIAYPIVDTLFSSRIFVIMSLSLRSEHHGQFLVLRPSLVQVQFSMHLIS
ncbi:hypothetical protein BDA96_01G118500 [Sorghum bicolor]|uniref:Uncharacterized protein n=2 Tax=Sorghum bicolor TaxID=4558 RepID=A0A921RWS9_SORBI|nr:hypothetical protein BDA96_01G118500 [Sorghum bicolor]KXG37712.1 hypothetical protein SORBI_3001G113600 [Sorghum bicolor]